LENPKGFCNLRADADEASLKQKGGVMVEWKYLEDIPRDIQDIIIRWQIINRWQQKACRAIKKEKHCSTIEANEECKNIVKKMQELNPDFELNPDATPIGSTISASQKGGCLFFVMGFILFGILVNLSNDMWSSRPEVGIIVGVCMLLAIIAGLKFFGVQGSDISACMMPSKPMPKPSGLPKQSELVKCKTCKTEISKTAPACPHCGENLPGFCINCPKCGSSNIGLGAKGYSLGKAAAGALILGPGGLLVGLHGRKNLELHCLSCGKKWKPKNLQ
jgi:tellurium resistance protein TerD